MRTYGRITNEDGSQSWQTVETDANGFNDAVWLTTLCQVLKLNKQESPFFANFGVSAEQSAIQQIYPDFDVALIQQQFSGYFASLTITKQAGPEPTYNVNVVTNQGAVLNVAVPIPQ